MADLYWKSLSNDRTHATYERTADRMAEKFRAQGPRTDDIERFFELIAKRDPVIVEIGCWDGRDAREICKHTSNYRGFDYSASMVQLARAYVPGVRFDVADVREFEFPENADGIVAFASLLHLSPGEIRPVLQRAFEALASKGVICISLKRGRGSLTREDEFGERTYWFYEPEDIMEMLPEAVLLHRTVSEIRGQAFFEIFLQKT